MKLLATIFKLKPHDQIVANTGANPFAFSDRPDAPYRATCACPFTGEHMEACGDSEQGALYALGQAVRDREMRFVEGRVSQAEVTI